MEIHNIGHLYGGLTIEQLSSKHPSRRRNERIAQVFHARKLIDRFGVCAEQNLPTPIFSEDNDGFLVKFFFKNSIGPHKESTFIAPELTERQRKILKCLGTYGALTTKELHGKLTNPPSERWLRDELNGLSLLGLVLSEGATTKKKKEGLNKNELQSAISARSEVGVKITGWRAKIEKSDYKFTKI